MLRFLVLIIVIFYYVINEKIDFNLTLLLQLLSVIRIVSAYLPLFIISLEHLLSNRMHNVMPHLNVSPSHLIVLFILNELTDNAR